MGTDEIHSKILKYASNKCFINAMIKLFKKHWEYKITPYIWNIAIIIKE